MTSTELSPPDINAGLQRLRAHAARPLYTIRGRHRHIGPLSNLGPAHRLLLRSPGTQLVCTLSAGAERVESVWNGEKWSDWK